VLNISVVGQPDLPELMPMLRAYCDFYRETFGPAVAAYADPGHAAAVDRDFLDFATRTNRGSAHGPSEYHYEYLLAVARKR